MKYVITGGAGNTAKPIAEKLAAAGHDVTVISRNPGHTSSLAALGIKTAAGSLEDLSFLSNIFTGADAVYTMVPPNFAAAPWKEWIASIGKNYALAIRAAGVKKVVNLSSIGAHMPEHCGPVSGLHYVETALNGLSETDVVPLRPGFFYLNLLGNINMIKHMNIIGANYGLERKIFLVHPEDIANAAVDALLDLTFTGKTIRYVVSDERTPADIAAVLGTAIGKPALPWVDFTDEQLIGGMTEAGLPEEVAKNYTEMGAAMRTGEMGSEYEKHKPSATGIIKLEDFAKDFAVAYNAD